LVVIDFVSISVVVVGTIIQIPAARFLVLDRDDRLVHEGCHGFVGHGLVIHVFVFVVAAAAIAFAELVLRLEDVLEDHRVGGHGMIRQHGATGKGSIGSLLHKSAPAPAMLAVAADGMTRQS